jgi:hypothetical protein
MQKPVFTIVGSIFAVLLFLPVQVQAFKLLSHRAVYDLSLAPGGKGKISHADGRLAIEWADTCDGYTTEQRMLLSLGVDGGVVNSDFQLSSWESKDGDLFRYDVKTTFAGAATEVFQGKAERQNDTGVAVFSRPKNLKLKLPKKIVFPSEHMARLIDSAGAGERQISMPMFDGTGKEGLFEAVGFVLGPVEKSSSNLIQDDQYPPGWRIQLSFFDLTDRDQLPMYKITLSLSSNGVVDDLTMEYPEFSVRGKLANFKVLESTGC